jgi:integral membrane sensor domain MASE1
MEKEHQVPIWFFIGSLLAVYGVLICGSGIYRWKFPPAVDTVALSHLHADIWWGGLLLVLGLIYVVRFWPSRQ